MELNLLKGFLKVTEGGNHLNITGLLNVVSEIIPSKMCSLWRVNKIAKCLSIYAREKFIAEANNESEFVHAIEGSLIGKLMKEDSGKVYYDIKNVQDREYIQFHKSPTRVQSLNLKRMISILIKNYDVPGEIDAILNIYPLDNVHFDDAQAQIISDYFSQALSRARLLSKERVTREIIQNYEKRGSKDLPSVLHPIIVNVFRKYCNYEGCSVFLWDPFLNRLSLTQSTGIESRPKKISVHYYLGEGLTGTLAEQKQIAIIPDLNNISMPNLKTNYEHKWKEETQHPGKSFMCLPIMSPSRRNELLGIIRFTNKLNQLGDVVDCFSLEDKDLIEHACNLIALYMEHEHSERIRTAFAMQMAHEMMTPAVAIRGSARRLQLRLGDPSFSYAQAQSYLSSIQEHAELQTALTRTIEYAWNGTSGKPRDKRYIVSRLKLIDIIEKSKKLVIPVARKEDLKFDNIEITGDYPSLYLDNFAFEQVFFNLFTNSIKYRSPNYPERFSIKVHGHGIGTYSIPIISDDINMKGANSRGYLVSVEDMGMGINKEEADKIFLLGYRTKNIEETNVRGLGMGLAVCKRVLTDFDCLIWLSNYRKPTKFNIFFPEKLSNKDYLASNEWKGR